MMRRCRLRSIVLRASTTHSPKLKSIHAFLLPFQRVDARKPRRLPSDGAFVFLLPSLPPMSWPVIEVIHHRIAYRSLPRLLPIASLDHSEHFAVVVEV